MRQLIALTILGLAACGNVEAEDSPDVLAETLAQSYGGEAETDEAPAFGDASLLATAEDVPAGDTMTDGRPELNGARRVRVAVVWGYLAPRPDATETIDWTGSLKVTNAALRVVRKLRFEPRDLVIRPRTEITTVEFESQTRPHADGLLVEVIFGAGLNPTGAPVTLTLTTGPFTGTITVQPGMRRSLVTPVDDAGHVVAYHVFGPDADDCREGLFRGVWKPTGEVDGREVGALRGRFVADDGLIRGFLRGVFGERENGKHLWFAKVVDRDGKFLGVAAGKYEDGKLAGLFLGRNREVRGVLRGVYGDRDGDGEGAFMGRYSERCGEDPREGQPSTGDEPQVDLADPAM